MTQMNIKLKISQRQSANREIIDILSDMVEEYPDLRFGQILTLTEAIKYVPVTGDVMDPFGEESVDMWVRMRRKMAKFNEDMKSLEE